jgi:hypothetical protein
MTINRQDGTIITLIVLGCPDLFSFTVYMDMFARIQHPNTDEPEYVYPQIMSKNTKKNMPRSEYIKSGRVGLLKYLKPSELLKALQQFQVKYP